MSYASFRPVRRVGDQRAVSQKTPADTDEDTFRRAVSGPQPTLIAGPPARRVELEATFSSCPDAPRRAAFHEAGHATMRLLHDLSFTRAYIAEDGTGGVEFERASTRGDRWRSALRCLAGPVAEAHYTNTPIADVLLAPQSTQDRRRARAEIAHTTASFTEAVETCERLVAWAWPGISAVAEVLAARGEIGPDEACDLINAVMA
jgi:hypothetical protein